MDIKKFDANLVGVKLERDDRNVLERAAHATVRTLGREATEAAAALVGNVTDGDKAEAEAKAAAIKAEANGEILAIGAVAKRIIDNRAPVNFMPVEEGIAVEVGEEGYTALDTSEAATAERFLRRYADDTVTVVDGYTNFGGINTSAADRAYYGHVANTMAEQ